MTTPANDKRPPRKKKKLKKLELEEKAREKGRILGQIAAHKKKPLKESLKEHIGHWIDNINPIEVAAISVGTVMVHGAIIKGGYIDQALTFWKGIAELVSPLYLVGEQFGVFPKDIRVMPEESIQLWLTSFFIAYIMVRHGGQILGLWEKGINAAVGMMMAT